MNGPVDVAVKVRSVGPNDAAELAAFGRHNREYHGEDFVVPMDAEAWQALAQDNTQQWFRVDTAHSGLAGVLCLVRWASVPWHTADLGAGADERLAGTGAMSAGLRLMLRSEMRRDHLERVDALIRPGHGASERFVTAGGLRLEGVARGALSRAGRRLDMNRWAILRTDITAGGRAS